MSRMLPKVIPQTWVWLQSPHSLHQTNSAMEKRLLISSPSTNSPVRQDLLLVLLSPATPPGCLGVSYMSSGIVWRLDNVWAMMTSKKLQQYKKRDIILHCRQLWLESGLGSPFSLGLSLFRSLWKGVNWFKLGNEHSGSTKACATPLTWCTGKKGVNINQKANTNRQRGAAWAKSKWRWVTVATLMDLEISQSLGSNPFFHTC